MIGTVVGFLLALAVISFAQAQGVHHHHGKTSAVDRFYSTWNKPDKPDQSCCNRLDCDDAQARYINGEWWALRKRDNKWLRIPPQKMELNRDSPDGRSHLCASLHSDEVYCFIVGAGG